MTVSKMRARRPRITMMSMLGPSPRRWRACAILCAMTILIVVVYLSVFKDVYSLIHAAHTFDEEDISRNVDRLSLSDLERAVRSSTARIQKTDAGSDHLILFWTPLLKRDSKYWLEYVGPQFAEHTCTKSCKLTNDKKLIEKASMVVFSAYPEDQIEPPKYRHPKQIWAFFSQESPATRRRTRADMAKWNDLFNWTITYRLDSDIKILYGKTERNNAAASQSAASDAIFEQEVSEIIRKKWKLVAAIISDCRAPSGRLKYIQDLRREGLEVHVYGKCGQHRCPTDRRDPPACYRLLSKSYKFFLAFENSLCRDYVTEKLFEALKHPWVPVVRGGANYTATAPPDSVVDASRMSPRDLAALLKNLSANDTRYGQFFKWKRKWHSVRSPPWACEACQKLHDASSADELTAGAGGSSSGSRAYPDMYDWWVTKSACRNK